MIDLANKNIKFSKMHGLGNDFMIVDAITQNVSFSTKLISKLGDRHLGIGFDQLLIVEAPYSKNIDFHYRIFNVDGTEVSQCGNGARCFAYFVKLKGLTKKNNIYVSTKHGTIILDILSKNMVRVNMGHPNFKAKHIPFYSNKAKKINNHYIININGTTITFGVLSIGNPHCIIQVKNIKNTQVELFGSILENHEFFPERINIGFMEIVNSNYIRLRVYERGVGETQSCGSGACAAVVYGIKQGFLSSNVDVELIGGILNIFWKGIGYPIYMIGPAIHVYDGLVNL